MISGDLEYLMSSLPYLSFDENKEKEKAVSECFRKYSSPGMSDLPLELLLEAEAAKYLSLQKSTIFREIRLDQLQKDNFTGSYLPLLAEFSKYLTSLREDLKELRIARRETEDQTAIERLPSPIKPGNPLEEEITILKLQWDRLEELSAMHYANFSALVAYKLKLMILQRLWSFDEKKGHKIFVETINELG